MPIRRAFAPRGLETVDARARFVGRGESRVMPVLAERGIIICPGGMGLLSVGLE